MQLVEHDALEAAEQIGRVGAGQQQRELLGRGEQDVGRIAALALALRGRRVAGAGLDADRQAHLARPALRGCARCRPPAPSAARCRACAGRRSVGHSFAGRNTSRAGLGCRARSISTRVGRKPASVLPPPVGAISSTDGRRGRAPAVPADARAASSRATRTSARKSPAAAARFRSCRDVHGLMFSRRAPAASLHHRACEVAARSHSMGVYTSIVRPLAFRLEAERAHHLAIKLGGERGMGGEGRAAAARSVRPSA